MWPLIMTFMAPEPGDDPGGGGGSNPTETMEVELWGTKVVLPKDEAQRVIAERDRRTSEFRELQTKVGQTEAQAQEAARKAEQAAREKEAIEAAKNGEVEKVRELMTADHKQESERLHGELTRLHLSNLLRSRKNVADKAVDTVSKLLLSDQQFAVKDGQLVVLGEDGRPLLDSAGQPVKTEAWLDKWLERNDYFLVDSTPPGDGSAGGAKPPEGNVEVISREEYEKRIAASGPEKTKTLRGIAEGKIQLKD